MPTPSELVTEAFATAQSYASNAQGSLTTFTNLLNQALTVTPLIDVSFEPVNDPGSATPAPYVPPSTYSSTLLTNLTGALNTRIAGGTGLAPADEAALWDRARERELATAQAAIDQVTRDAEALGWALPTGWTVDAVRRETRAYYDKSAEVSREIALKQADLEQSNIQKTIDQGIQLETAIADIAYKRTAVTVDQYKAEIMRFEAEVSQDVKHWEAQIKQYEAQITYTLNAQKLNAEITRANASSILDAAKVGAQVYAQLTASAYSLIHASASVSAGASNSVSWSYSNDTATAPSSVTSV
jgi:hypothetical protein